MVGDGWWKLDAGYSMLDTRSRMLDTGCWMHLNGHTVLLREISQEDQ